MRIILTIIFCSQVFMAVGQNEESTLDKNQWTAGVIVLGSSDQIHKVSPSVQAFTGVTLKRQFHSFSVRITLEHAVSSVEPTALYFRQTQMLYTSSSMIRLGIEKGIIFKKYFRPYFAVDLAYFKSKWAGITYIGLPNRGNLSLNAAGGSNITSQPLVGPIAESKNKSNNGLGILPTLGFELILTAKISLAIESHLRFFIERTGRNDEGVYYENMTINFAKLGALTININF